MLKKFLFKTKSTVESKAMRFAVRDWRATPHYGW